MKRARSTAFSFAFAVALACGVLGLTVPAQATVVWTPPPAPAPPSLQASAAAGASPGLTSPDGRLRVRFHAGSDNSLHYEVLRDGQAVVLPSPLGLDLANAKWRVQLLLQPCSRPVDGRERYPLIGKKRQVDSPYRAMRCVVTNAKDQPMTLEWRAFNDGVAFRYVVSLPEPRSKVFMDEYTGLRLRPDTRAFLQPMQPWHTGWKGTNPAYEEHYAIDTPVGQPARLGVGWAFPALFRSGDTWIAVTEAGMDGSFHASRLWPDNDFDRSFQAAPASGGYQFGWPRVGETGGGTQRLAEADGRMTTPWRVIAIGDLPTLMQSTLGTDLAAPAVTFPAAKLKPGPASWSWALLKDEGTVFEVQKRYIDYAADMHWPYTLIDADWDRKIGWPRIQELAAYGRRKGVGLWLWYNSSGEWNDTEYTPKGALIDPAQRRAEFRKLAAAGIKGVKIDFFGGDGQSVIRYYVDILEDAAQAGLLVNFHGATLPRGWNRTYPNLMTAEAVKGFEFATFEQVDQDAVPEHLAMLPFTRNLFDPMDFTPVVFGDIPNIKRATRNGFELALSVLLVSGVQHYAETPDGMATVPDSVRQFLRTLPRQWDDVRFLTGEPGRFVALARRAGDRWIVAGINAEDEPRTIEMDLGFLAGRTGALIGEGEGPRDFRLGTLPGGGLQRVTLPAKGGFVASFEAGRP